MNKDKNSTAVTFEVRNSETGAPYLDKGVVKPRSLKGAISFAEKTIAQHFDGDLLRGVDAMVLVSSAGTVLTLQEAIILRRSELETDAQAKIRKLSRPEWFNVRLVNGDMWEEDDEVCIYTLESAIEAIHAFLNGAKAGGLSYETKDVEIVNMNGEAITLAVAAAMVGKNVAGNLMATENQLVMTYLESLVGNHRAVHAGKKSRLSISRYAAGCAARALLNNWSAQLDKQSQNNLVQDVDAIVAVLKRLKGEARQLFSVQNGGYGGKTLAHWEEVLKNHGGVFIYEVSCLKGEKAWSFSYNGDACDDNLICKEREDLVVAAILHFNLA